MSDLKIRYRPHRGSLEAAMREYREFDSVADMFQFVSDEWCSIIKDYVLPEDLVIHRSSGPDDRIGWKASRNLCTTRFGDTYFAHPQCIGMCDLREKG